MSWKLKFRVKNHDDIQRLLDEVPSDKEDTDEESISDSDGEGGGYANGDALDQAQSKTSKHTVDDLIDTDDDIDEQSNSTSDKDDTDEQSNSSSGEDDPQTASNKKQVPYLEKVKYLEQYIDKRRNKDAEFSKTELKDLSGKLAKVGDKKEDVKPGKVQSLLEVARQRWRKKTTQTKADMFSSPEGVKPGYFDAQKETPGTVFLKFLDDDIITDILYQTNLYMTQKHRRISPILKREFYGFIGMNIIMSYHILPAIRDYWRTDLDLAIPYIASVMPRDRFRGILSNLHVNDNEKIEQNNKDKLYKLRPLIVSLNANFVKLYNVAKEFSIDESMIRFKGRSSIKQYNPLKPIKRGYKLWVRADSDGYISKFDIYQGKLGQDMDDSELSSLGEKVVTSMCSDVYQKNHNVYFDNYFMSLPLLEHLKYNGVHACGTVRANRKGLPIDFMSDKELTPRGKSDIRVSESGISVYKWKDSKSIMLASNFHGSEIETCTRTLQDGTKKEFDCPKAVVDYNKSMGGVDKADMLCAIHGRDRKSMKWWHRIFFGLIDRAIVNSQVVYSKLQRGQNNISTFDFRRAVAQSLVTLSRKPQVGRPLSVEPTPTAQKRRRQAPSVSRDVRLQNLGAHWIVFSEIRGRCEVCSITGVESRPKSTCKTCGVHLCCNQSKNCFNVYHGVSEV